VFFLFVRKGEPYRLINLVYCPEFAKAVKNAVHIQSETETLISLSGAFL